MGTIIVNIKYCEFSGSRGGEYKVYSLPGFNAEQLR
jgi:hypothetical protein